MTEHPIHGIKTPPSQLMGRPWEREVKETNQAAKILIVDDEPFNIDILEQELEGLGYQTINASNGEEALEKVKTEAPDLILLDVMMPGLDGFTVCRLLKEQKETQLIPVVFMTALGEKADQIKGIEAGGYAFFTKPPDREILLARIQNAIEMKKEMDKRLAPPDQFFHREGEYWTIAYQRKMIRVKDTTGMRYLAYLLRHPHKEIRALALAASVEDQHEGALAIPPGGGTRVLAEPGMHEGLGSAGAILDDKAKADYLQRLKELEAELEDARRCNDLGRSEKAQREKEFLTWELQKAVGLGGKDKESASSDERARVNVQRAIKVAIERIAEHNPALGRYLAATINTGMFCSYTPDIDLPSSWKF